MSFKYSIVDLDKDTYKQFKKILKNKKKPQESLDDNLDLNKSVIPDDKPKKRRGRPKLSKEEKEKRKKNRSPEEVEKIKQRMAKLREARKAKKNLKK